MEFEEINQNNLFSLYRKIGTICSGSSIFNFEEFQVVKTQDSVWPNIAFGLKADNYLDNVITSIDKEMNALGMHPLIIAGYTPEKNEKFKSNRFRPIQQWQNMFLIKLDERKIANIDLNSRLTLIEREDEIECWTRLVSEVLFNAKNVDVEIFKSLKRTGAKFVGLKIDEELVGTSMIYYDDAGFAGIYMVAVKKAFRGRGLGKALINFCLGQIKRDNKDECFLQSTDVGSLLYDSLSFQRGERYFLYWKI